MSDAYDSDGDDVADSSQAGVSRAPLDVARDKMEAADEAMMRASRAEDVAAVGGVTAVGVAAGGAAALASPTGPGAGVAAGIAGTAAAVGALTNYDAKTDTTEAAIDTAEEARRTYNDEATKSGLPTVNVGDTAYEARPWHTDPGRAFDEKVEPIVEEVSQGASDAYDLLSTGAGDAYKYASEGASSAYDSVAETASETYDAVANYFGGGEEQQQ
jgi:hypothetical protein